MLHPGGFHGSYRNHDSSLAHAPTLKIIQEDVFIEPSNESSNTAELSTIVASTGEVSSSASFPFQAREHNNDSTIVLEVRWCASWSSVGRLRGSGHVRGVKKTLCSNLEYVWRGVEREHHVGVWVCNVCIGGVEREHHVCVGVCV